MGLLVKMSLRGFDPLCVPGFAVGTVHWHLGTEAGVTFRSQAKMQGGAAPTWEGGREGPCRGSSRVGLVSCTPEPMGSVELGDLDLYNFSV